MMVKWGILLVIAVCLFQASDTAIVGLPSNQEFLVVLAKIAKELGYTPASAIAWIKDLFSPHNLNNTDEALFQSIFSNWDRPVNGTEYDMVVHADSLIDINKGWKVVTFPAGDTTVIETFENFEGQFHCYMGTYDAGKTHVINHVENISLPSGYGMITSAFSLKRSKLNNNVVIIDTAGQRRTVSSGLQNDVKPLEDRIATDDIINQLLVQICDVIYYVVGPLTIADVTQIRELNRQRQMLGHAGETFIVIHNYYNQLIEVDIHKKIKDEIIGTFNATSWNNKYVSDSKKMLHLTLGRDGMPAGVNNTKDTYNYIRDKTTGAHSGQTKQNFFNKLIVAAENIFPEYFRLPTVDVNRIQENYNPVAVKPSEQTTKIEYGWKDPSYWLQLGDKALHHFWAVVSPTKTTTPAKADTVLTQLITNAFKLVFDKKNMMFKLVDDKIKLNYLPVIGDKGIPLHDIFFVDIMETNTGVCEWSIFIDVPGFSEQNLKLFCPKNKKTGFPETTKIYIIGYRPPPHYTANQRQTTQFNRKYGMIQFEVDLPAGIICADILSQNNYKLENGVLWITDNTTTLEQRLTAVPAQTQQKDEL